jgi:hypothetical protein
VIGYQKCSELSGFRSVGSSVIQPIQPNSFGSLVQFTKAGKSQFSKKKIVYSDEPLGAIELVTDFLPAPADSAFREESPKVMLARSKPTSLDFSIQRCTNIRPNTSA